MTGAPGPVQVPVDLAMPGTQRPVQRWVGTPANRTGAPLRTMPAPEPQVVFAERKPRLTRPEMMARHGGATTAPAPVGRPVLSVVNASPATARSGRGPAGPRAVRWLLFIATALVAAASTPVL